MMFFASYMIKSQKSVEASKLWKSSIMKIKLARNVFKIHIHHIIDVYYMSSGNEVLLNIAKQKYKCNLDI